MKETVIMQMRIKSTQSPFHLYESKIQKNEKNASNKPL